MKVCKKCGEEKSDDDFYKEPRSKDGLQARCKVCCKADAKAVFEANPEPYRERARRAYNSTDRRARTLAKYGLTLDDYDRMFDEQDGCCAICGTKESGHNETTHLLVDHCHETNKVRGLLCSSCNLMLGKAHDNIDILSNAINYLNPQYA